MALLKPKVQVMNQDGERIPVVDSKNLSEYINEWVESDGKPYKHIPQSVGAGAPGSSSTTPGRGNIFDKAANLTEIIMKEQKIA
jgi:hypothetical protein